VGRPWRKSELLSKTTKEDLLVLAELLESGGATPVTYRTHPLSETAAAIAYVGYRTIEGPFDWTGGLRLDPTESGATRITSYGQIKLRGLQNLLAPLMAGKVRRGEAAELKTLKGLIEGSPNQVNGSRSGPHQPAGPRSNPRNRRSRRQQCSRASGSATRLPSNRETTVDPH
jgi:hypothetical protein